MARATWLILHKAEAGKLSSPAKKGFKIFSKVSLDVVFLPQLHLVNYLLATEAVVVQKYITQNLCDY